MDQHGDPAWVSVAAWQVRPSSSSSWYLVAVVGGIFRYYLFVFLFFQEKGVARQGHAETNLVGGGGGGREGEGEGKGEGTHTPRQRKKEGKVENQKGGQRERGRGFRPPGRGGREEEHGKKRA
jgi:hypothetical protein